VLVMSESAALAPRTGGALGVLWNGRAYLAIAYVLAEFALGTFYFVFLVTVLSVGLSLVWTFVGLAVVVGGLVASRSLAALDCALAEAFTGKEMPRVPVLMRPDSGFWRRLVAVLADADSWRSVVFLLFRFPLGVFGFSVVVGLVASSLWMIWQPLIVAVGVHSDWIVWHIDTVWKGALFVVPGLLLLPLSLWAAVGMAAFLAESGRWMVGRVGQTAMRRMVLCALSGARGLDGPSLLTELQVFHGYSVDFTATKLYGTLVGLQSAGLVEAEAGADGQELYRLTSQGREAVAG
jgi:hypothetical protein